MEHIIYGLIDPNTNELRYIGYTSYQIKRYNHHHRLVNLTGKSHKNNWIKSLLVKGQKAEMYILETYETAEELPQAEIELIEYYKSIGCNLTNGTLGGEGFKGKHSEETLKKMSEKSRGKKKPPRTEEHKRKLSESRKGKPSALKGRSGFKHSEETLKKMSEAHKGKKIGNHSEETRRKMSESAKLRKHFGKK